MESIFSVNESGSISDGKQEYSIHEVATMLNHMEHREKMLLEVIHLIPECDDHGNECLPHAKDWISGQLQPQSRKINNAD